MKKERLKLFRNVFANLLIAVMLIVLMGVSYFGGVLNVFSSGDYTVYYHGLLENKSVSLMINVYWGDEYLEPMLDILKEHEVKTTFFVGGMWASKNNEMLKRMIEDGHELGNHGFYHKDHKTLSLEKNQEEIYNTHQLIKSITGVEMKLFAPPSGAFSQTTLNVAKNLGYHTVMWTKDTIDWKEKNSQVIFNRAVKNASGGDLILMHPTEATLATLEKIIEYFKDKSLNLTTVSKNIGV
jgi:probable sporulation protein (polysaccharide deacetylase family)